MYDFYQLQVSYHGMLNHPNEHSNLEDWFKE